MQADMKYDDLLKYISDHTDLHPRIAKRVITLFTRGIATTVANGGSVTVNSLGTFRPNVRKGYQAVDPRTREQVEVPEKVQVLFRPAMKFKKTINPYL